MDNTGTTELQGYLLIYLFVCFSVGIACLSVTVVTAKRKGDTLARAFLFFYVSLSLVVIGIVSLLGSIQRRKRNLSRMNSDPHS